MVLEGGDCVLIGRGCVMIGWGFFGGVGFLVGVLWGRGFMGIVMGGVYGEWCRIVVEVGEGGWVGDGLVVGLLLEG